MPSPFIVVLVVALGTGEEATATSRTVQEALGSDALVVLRDESNLDDAYVSRLGQQLHADALIRITWTRHDSQTQAHVRLYGTAPSAWSDKDVTFAPGDPAEERGRALGYGIASIVRGEEAPPGVQAASAPAAPPPPPPPPPAAPPPPPPPRAPPFQRVIADASFQGAAPLAGEGASLGAEGAVGYRLLRPLAIRMGFAFRAGTIEPAHATATYLRVGPGVSLTLFETGDRRPLAIGTRLDVVALRVAAAREDGPSRGARWMGAMDALVDVAWAVFPRVGLVAAAGAEVASESTRINVDAREATRIAPVRALGEVGVRFRFD